MLRKTIAGVMLASMALLAAGCGDTNVEGDSWGSTLDAHEVTVTLNDGRRLPCIRYDRSISCDWANAKHVR